jgi:hypothetical protein
MDLNFGYVDSNMKVPNPFRRKLIIGLGDELIKYDPDILIYSYYIYENIYRLLSSELAELYHLTPMDSNYIL